MSVVTETLLGRVKNAPSSTDACDEGTGSEGFDSQQIGQIRAALAEHLPSRTYLIAVWFLGFVTVILAVGSLYLLTRGPVASEALWTALGTGIGGLAGVFSARS